MESGKELRRRKDDEKFPLSEKERKILKQLGQQKLRIHNDVANDALIQILGIKKIWNSYPPNEFESFFRQLDMIPRGFYYSTFDVDTNELVFLAQDKTPIKSITKLRHKINAWFVRHGW